MSRWPSIALFGALALSPLLAAQAADETSSGDKLRILYSSRFSFADSGAPLVTVAIMEGQREVRLGAEGGVVVRPDGRGGAEIAAGSQWTVTAEGARPGSVREWTVVDRLPPDDARAADAAEARWKQRGHRVERFEVGTVFAVDGDVMDTRELLVAIDPVAAPKGSARARAIAERYGIATEVHAELVRRPEGTIVAKSGDVVVKNPSVIWFGPARRDDTIEVRDVVTGSGGSQKSTGRQDRRYFGAVYVTIGRDGKLVVANAVAADDLLAGLVPAEMYPSAPRAALEAQAIAARTELLQKIGTRHLGDPFLLCSTQHCQVYAGAGNEHPRTTAAVRATRGQVLLRKGGGLVDARYSASCGGHSEHNESVWGGRADPSLRGHFDGARAGAFADGVDGGEVARFLDIDPDEAWCGRTRFSKGRFRWRARIDAAQLDRAFARTHPRVGSIRAFEPIERGVSGRITKLRVRGTKGNAVLHGELAIRRALGGLRSSLFVSSVIGSPNAPSAFEFRGGGFGHGVGMCQLGAMGMADAGRSAVAILQHYYPSSTVHRLF